MDELYDEFKSLLGSLSWYACRATPLPYTELTLTSWKGRNKDAYKNILDKLALTDIKLDHIPRLTELYFDSKLRNNIGLTTGDRKFLKHVNELELFMDSTNILDLRDKLLEPETPIPATDSIGTSTSRAIIQSHTGKRITLSKLSGTEEELDDWFEDFIRLGKSENWDEATCGLKVSSYLSDVALLIWKGLDTTLQYEFRAIRKAIINALDSEKSFE